MSAAARVNPRIPVCLTGFIGRQAELREVSALLEQHRLITLVGAGGAGKTRLGTAVAEAWAAQSAAHDVVWVELAPLSDGALISSQIAASLGVRLQGGASEFDALVAALDHRSLLLVLDGCEHLIDSCAALTDTLLNECRHLHILTTSRQSLGITGEKTWLVPPLALPDQDATDVRHVAESEAVQLFVQRATDASASFSLNDSNAAAIVHICRRLDGLPLAIELAAARVKLLPPDQLARRLDDVLAILTSGVRTRLPRHRTLKALIDWSYNLLSAQERLLLARLGVFNGGFTLDAAEQVTAFEGLEECDVLDTLAALVDKSLVTMRERDGEARYTLLETVRQYALARLNDMPESDCEPDSVRELHSRYYRNLAAAAAEDLHGPDQVRWLTRLDAEFDNIRATIEFALAARDSATALEVCAAMGDFWRMRSHLLEGRRWCELALAQYNSDDATTAGALNTLAMLLRMLGDHDLAHTHLVRAREIGRSLGDARLLARTLTLLGSELQLRREVDAARDALEEAITLWRQLGDARLSFALSARASLAATTGDLAQARALRREAAETARRLGDREGEAHALVGLAEVARQEGDYTAARAYNERSSVLFTELRDGWHLAVIQHNLGWVAARSHDFTEALRKFNESTQLFCSAGNPIGTAACLAGLSVVAQARGNLDLAASALGTATRHFARVGIKPASADQRDWDRTRAELEASLGAEFERAWARDLHGAPRDAVDYTIAQLDQPVLHAVQVQSHRPPADLCVRALGELEVYCNGVLLTNDAWGSARPRELLIFLLCHPLGCTREQVGVAFWPDATAAQVSNSFHVALHRLRKALGHPEWVRIVDERYRVASDIVVDFDVATFEAEAKAALQLRRNGDNDAVPRLRSAVELYRGDFLQEEVAGDWSADIRDRLQRMYIECTLALADELREAGHFAEAAAEYRNVIARNDLHEHAYRQLMICLAGAGERGQALRLFQRLTTVLRDELDATPEPETLEVFNRLQLSL